VTQSRVTRLQDRGVKFDFQYVSDSLWNIKSEQKERFASWNRFRGTLDIDFGALTGQHGLYFHATALRQAGGNLGAYLGLPTSPSGMSSANTFRLDSWWIEKRWLANDVLIVERLDPHRPSIQSPPRRAYFLRFMERHFARRYAVVGSG
jgi:carbohydrate-selective porin OprB